MHKLGVDIGGTFTDVVLTDTRTLHSEKVLTTPGAPELGAIKGIETVLQKTGVSLEDIAVITHGTTLAANSIIQRKGAKTAFITTKGFRDVLEMRYEKRFDQYDLNIKLPEPLVPRQFRFTINERCQASGKITVEPSELEVNKVARTLLAEKIEAVAIGFIHSYVNPKNEQFVAKVLRSCLPSNVTICTSFEICPEAREYERFSTTVANSFVRPLMINYLNNLSKSLRKNGFTGSLLLMSSDSGITTVNQAKRTPIRLVESGPAGGVILASQIARTLKENKVVSIDIGGTTAKICYLEKGRAIRSRNFEIARSQVGKKGSGLPLRIPSVDLLEIGAGGGSIAYVDDIGRIRVGPESAGSSPGPACYSLGGNKPTITDSNLLIGRISKEFFSAEDIVLDKILSEKAIKDHIQSPLRFKSSQWAATGIIEVAEDFMANSVRAHGIELGKNISEFTMIASGGGGGLHAVGIAKKLGIKKIVIPKMAGVGSALGFLYSSVNYQIAQSVLQELMTINWTFLKRTTKKIMNKAMKILKELSIPETTVNLSIEVELRFKGQGHQLIIPVKDEFQDLDSLAKIQKIFFQKYKKKYGFLMPGVPVELVTLLVSCKRKEAKMTSDKAEYSPQSSSQKEISSPIFDYESQGWKQFTSIDRKSLMVGYEGIGPKIIREKQTTTIVPLGWKVTIHKAGHLILEKENENEKR